MATLLTHLGLILFLVAAAVDLPARRRAGPRRPRGRVADRPADRHARAAAGQEPRLRGARVRHRPGDRLHDRSRGLPGRPARSRARRSGSTIRCRSPGYTFHQNGFGPAPHLVVHDAAGAPLWDGAGPDDRRGGRACRTRDRRSPAATSACSCCSTRTPTGSGSPDVLPVPGRPARTPTAHPIAGATARRSTSSQGDVAGVGRASASRSCSRTSASTRCSSRSTIPGQGIVWLAFASPHRRASRSPSTCRAAGSGPGLTSDGRLGIVWRSDRYVDVEREFGRLLDDLVAARRPA